MIQVKKNQEVYLVVQIGGVGFRGGACCVPGEEAGVAGGQREAVGLDHAPELRRTLGGNRNLGLQKRPFGQNFFNSSFSFIAAV